MSDFSGIKTKTNTESKMESQKIAFAPVAFQTAIVMRDTNILDYLFNSGEKGCSLEDLYQNIELSKYSIKVLIDAAVSMDIVFKKEDKYILTKTGYFILKDNMTRVNMDFIQDVCYEGLFYLDESIKKNIPAGLKVFGDWPTVYHALSALPEKVKKSWFAFDHYYSDSAFYKAIRHIFKTNPKTILDVGGNTGKFSIECAKYSDDISITILDLPGQLNEAEKKIKEYKFEKQINLHPYDLLDHSKPFPKGFDIIWMSQFLVCFGEDDVINLLKRAKDAMNEDSSLYILETFPDKQRFEAASYCLNMSSLYFTAIASGKSRIYMAETMEKYLDKAGLKIIEEKDNISLSHTLLRCKIN